MRGGEVRADSDIGSSSNQTNVLVRWRGVKSEVCGKCSGSRARYPLQLQQLSGKKLGGEGENARKRNVEPRGRRDVVWAWPILFGRVARPERN